MTRKLVEISPGVFLSPLTARQKRQLRAMTDRPLQSGEVRIRHAETCPCSNIDFEPSLEPGAPSACTCDFGERLMAHFTEQGGRP